MSLYKKVAEQCIKDILDSYKANKITPEKAVTKIRAAIIYQLRNEQHRKKQKPDVNIQADKGTK